LNIYSNKLKRVRKYHNNVYQWTADQKGKLVLASGIDGAGEVLTYAVKGRRLDKLKIDHLLGETAPEPLAVAQDRKSMWVIANYDSDTRGIHRLLLEDASVVETLFQDEKYDVGSLYLHPTLRHPVVSGYTSTTQSYRWADKDIEKQFTELKAAIPGKPSRVTFVGSDDALNLLLLHTEGNGTLPSYYLFDRSHRELKMIGSAYSSVGEIRDLESVSYKARDNVEIPAYLALPDEKAKGPFPTILLPHGGPWNRDTDEFDYWVQFFLSRGYAVIKPNFRGSSGYGDAFMANGFMQWGLKMQDDLIDGLDWMVEQGYTDPTQVCIVGGSYGGYAALVAAHKTPERFKCAISFAGVTDLNELNRQWRNFGVDASAVRLQSGDERSKNSPIMNVDKIDIPLLIVHGDVDRRVMIEQSREFVKALEKAGKPYTYVEQKNGNHHLSLESHRIEFFEAMDRFLSKHLMH
jgi:dipeptidyl aminopeptidase/acylaminoacyl peptidase